MKLHANELQGRFRPLEHILKNYKCFFTHGVDDISIKGINILLNAYAKNPKKI